MREDKWRKEENARVSLMKDVYDSRAQNVDMKKKYKDQALWMLQREKEMIDADITRQTQEHENKKVTDMFNKKQHQTDVLRQAAEKDRTNRRDLQDKMYEERAAKLAEIEYVRKIQHQKDDNNTVLQQWRQQTQTQW